MQAVEYLNVYWNEAVVGYLSSPKIGKINFTYDSEWLKAAKPAISISLPTSEEHHPDAAMNFFGNLLPEGDFRKKLEKLFQVSAKNDYSLLKQLGGDCAGALSIGRQNSSEEGFYEEISNDQLQKIIRTEGASGFKGDGITRLSLAGAQGKLPVAIIDNKLSLPHNGAPSTHIMKFNKPDGQYARLVENEYFMTRIAYHIGIKTISCELARVKNDVYFISERYDRKKSANSWPEKIHQEDFCQALGIPALAKHEKEGGPSFADCIKIARDQLDLKSIDRMLTWIIFNIATGNSDAHAKNISFLYENNSSSLAPIYDLVCTRAYPKLDRSMAMAIGGTFDPDLVNNMQIDVMAKSVQMTAKFIRSRIVEVTNKLPHAVSKAKIDLEKFGIKANEMNQIYTTIEKQISRFAKRF